MADNAYSVKINTPTQQGPGEDDPLLPTSLSFPQKVALLQELEQPGRFFGLFRRDVVQPLAPQQWNWAWAFVIVNIFLGGGASIAVFFVGNRNTALFGQQPNIHNISIAAQWCSQMFSMTPLFVVLLTLAVPKCQAHFVWWFRTLKFPLAPLPILLTLSWTIGGAILSKFNPLSFVFVFCTSICALGALRNVRGQLQMTWIDAVVWLWFWVPIDYRWYTLGYWYGVGSSDFDWWALAFPCIFVVGFGIFREWHGFGFSLIPRWYDFLHAFIAIVALAAPIVPIGWGIGFLHIAKYDPNIHNAPLIISTFTEIFFCTALHEEMFFRMLLLNGLHTLTRRRWLALLLSSLAFGLMHWPRESELPMQLAYVAFASWAGICYGTAYLWSGKHILASMLTHAITDTTWAFLLGGGL